MISRLLGFLLLLGTASSLRAHGTELLGGRITTPSTGEVVMELDIQPFLLSFFAGDPPTELQTWGDVRGRAGVIAECFNASLRLRVGDAELAPTATEFRPLTGAYPPSDAMNLPTFVPLTVIWRHVPSSKFQVVPRFNLSARNFVLTLEDATGPNPALVDDRAALSGHALPPGFLSAAPPPSAPPAVEPLARTLGRALVVGIEHIVPEGLDHILFVLGLYLAARRFRDLLVQVSAFTVAHCLTLGLAMEGIIRVGPAWGRLVEITIALSIVIVAFENCLRGKTPGWGRLALVASFGLIHGLGFAGALSEVHWPAGRFLPALIAANIGIEIGQLLVVGAAALVSAWWWRCSWYQWRVAIPASVIIGLCGLTWAIRRALDLA